MTICAKHGRWTKIEYEDGRAAQRDCPECPKRTTERCPICGGLNPGDASHTRCM